MYIRTTALCTVAPWDDENSPARSSESISIKKDKSCLPCGLHFTTNHPI